MYRNRITGVFVIAKGAYLCPRDSCKSKNKVGIKQESYVEQLAIHGDMKQEAKVLSDETMEYVDDHNEEEMETKAICAVCKFNQMVKLINKFYIILY